MATTTNITSTYSGEFAGKYIQAALLASPTLGNQTITIKPNVKYKEVVKLFSSASILANATCDFTPVGTLTLTERVLTPKELEVDLSLCKKDFHSDWEAIEMGYSAFDVLPKNFTDFLIGNISKTVGAAIENGIWQGTNAAGDMNTGFTWLFKADSTVLDVSGTTITSSNVIGEMAKVVAKIATTKIYSGAQKPTIYVATDVLANYLIALGGYGASGLGSNGFDSKGPTFQQVPLYYAGLPVVEAPGLPTGQMVCTSKDNLWFGTGLLSDFNKVQVLDMENLDASQNVRFVMRFTAGVQYGVGAEIAYYWIY
jgi:hypothetical protein